MCPGKSARTRCKNRRADQITIEPEAPPLPAPTDNGVFSRALSRRAWLRARDVRPALNPVSDHQPRASAAASAWFTVAHSSKTTALRGTESARETEIAVGGRGGARRRGEKNGGEQGAGDALVTTLREPRGARGGREGFVRTFIIGIAGRLHTLERLLETD